MDADRDSSREARLAARRKYPHGPESFTPGTSKKVQGGRINPR